MDKNGYFAGIDAGTTGATALLVDSVGNVAGSAYREYPCLYPHPGWVEQDIDIIWQSICEASQELFSESGVSPSDIFSIGISSQRGTFVCLDPSRKPLHRSIVWNDCRATEQAEELSERISPNRYQEITGMPISALWAAPKIMWLIENRPNIIRATHKIVNGQEFLLGKFGAKEHYSDPSSLTLNGMMAIEKLDWSREVVSAIKFPQEKLPEMVHPCRREGVVSKDAATQSGFAEGTPICRGGGDQQCAAVGAGVIREGMAEITIGTAAMMVAHVENLKPEMRTPAYVGGHAIPDKWDLEGGAFATGACLRWWRDVFGALEQKAANTLGLDVYDLMTMEASKAPPGCKGYLFFPFLNGQVTPTYENQARGGSIGLTLAHDRATMIRSVLEGTAYELRMVLEALEKVLGRKFDTLRLTGGGAKSTLWCQIQADVFGKAVETLEVSECTALGAAILGAVSAGAFSTLEEAIKTLVHPKQIIEPGLENNEIYNTLFSIFEDCYHTLRESNIYSRLAKLQNQI